MEKKISVILVNYNGGKYNEACIDFLRRGMDFNNEFEVRLQIIVVDNASTDGSVRALREKYGSQIELIESAENEGFSAANNRGILRAKQWGADFVLLLNNDTEIAPDMIKYLLECADRYPQSVIVPKIYYSGDRKRLWFAGGSVSSVVRKISHDGLDQIDEGQFDRERQIPFATGCCLFIPAKALERAGLLDERFFLYYEDVEYSFRLQKNGISIRYCPEAYLYHKVGASSKGEDSALCAYYISRNWLLCSREHMGKRFWLFLLYYIPNRAACCMLWLFRGKPQLVKAALLGMRDYARRRFGKTAYFG